PRLERIGNTLFRFLPKRVHLIECFIISPIESASLFYPAIRGFGRLSFDAERDNEVGIRADEFKCPADTLHELSLLQDKVVRWEESDNSLRIASHDMKEGKQNSRAGLTAKRLNDDVSRELIV